MWPAPSPAQLKHSTFCTLGVWIVWEAWAETFAAPTLLSGFEQKDKMTPNQEASNISKAVFFSILGKGGDC